MLYKCDCCGKEDLLIDETVVLCSSCASNYQKSQTTIDRSIYLSFIGITNKSQAELQKKHKDPYQYAIDVLANVPGFISIEEAKESIEKYNKEWTEAV